MQIPRVSLGDQIQLNITAHLRSIVGLNNDDVLYSLTGGKNTKQFSLSACMRDTISMHHVRLQN